jgi:hypothetical protein
VTPPPAGRGHPVTFDDTAQDEYLRLLAAGVRVGDAADKLGISRRTPTQLAARNRQFADRLATAKTTGRTARIPHGTAGGYNNHACRCSRCTQAATQARVANRAHEADATAQVHTLTRTQQQAPETKMPMLARVS